MRNVDTIENVSWPTEGQVPVSLGRLWQEQALLPPDARIAQLGQISIRGLEVEKLGIVDSYEQRVFDQTFSPVCVTKADLKREDRGWPVDDSRLLRYFEGVHMKEGSPYDALDKHVGKSAHNVGVDIAGGTNGVAVGDLITERYVARGIYTHFFDGRDPKLRNPMVDIVTGDLATTQPWLAIRQWQKVYAPAGFAVALHVPRGGLQEWPAVTYYAAVAMVMTMMRSGGVFFTQIPKGVLNCANQEERITLYNAVRHLPQVRAIELASSNRYSTAGYDFCAVYAK